jgi:hypothetical protein
MTSTSSSLTPCELLIRSGLQRTTWVQFEASYITYTTTNGVAKRLQYNALVKRV